MMEAGSQDPKGIENNRDELELQTYYLGTLFDISKDLFGTLDTASILQNFLLMTMGNFGVVEGFILTINLDSKETLHFVSNGFHNVDLAQLENSAKEIILHREITTPSVEEIKSKESRILPEEVARAAPFQIDKNSAGIMCLGSKIIDEPYTEDEKKLLITLINTMIIALQNAGAFEEINQLNKDLLEKSQQLEKTVVELKAAMKKVAKYSKHLEQIIAALNVAQEVQQSLLPQNPPKEERLDIAGRSLYCDETGGDYYDYIELPRLGPDTYAIVVGDVSGHGISSALLMAGVRAYLRSRVSQAGSAAEIISDVNRLVSADTIETNQFMTLFFLVLESQNRRISWVRAGHDPALLYTPDADHFEKLEGQGLPLGVEKSWQYRDYTKTVRPGQILILTTDGILETRNKNGEMFGRDRVKEIIRRYAGLGAEGIRLAVIDAVTAFRGESHQEDDITLVVLKFL
jgi:serine phosphatase RsbU (regulator of sigma subunit)